MVQVYQMQSEIYARRTEVGAKGKDMPNMPYALTRFKLPVVKALDWGFTFVKQCCPNCGVLQDVRTDRGNQCPNCGQLFRAVK